MSSWTCSPNDVGVSESGRPARLLRMALLGAICSVMTACSAQVETSGDAVALDTTSQKSIGPTFTFPLKVSANQRYLVDQNNVPFLVNGFNPQSIVTGVDPADFNTIFATKASQGVNAADVWLIQDYSKPDSSTWDGIKPFTGTLAQTCDYGPCWDLSTPNEAYFARVDALVAAANQNNIVLFTTPIDGPVGFHETLVANGTTRANQYGQYLGNRYKNHHNIVWWMGGDYFDVDVNDKARMAAVASGIKSTDTVKPKLFVLQLAPTTGTSSLDGDWSVWGGLVTLSGVYNYNAAYYKQHVDYGRTLPAIMPSFLMEPKYEDEGVTGRDTRKVAWWSITSGSVGTLYGASHEWQLGAPFPNKSLLNNPTHPGAIFMQHLRTFFDGPGGFNWWDLVPDRGPGDPVNGSTIVTQGMCTSGSNSTSCYGNNAVRTNYYATTARTSNGSAVVIYIPSSRTVRVDMTKLCGTSTVKWFNPTNGAYTTVGTSFANTGTQDFTTPPWTTSHQSNCDDAAPQSTTCNDWVLTLNTNAPCSGAVAPTTTTSAASNVGASGASLNGSANPHGAQSTGWFRYSSTHPSSCDDTFGTRAPATGGVSLGSGGSTLTYTQPVTGLAASTTYYFCAIASNPVGVTPASAVLSFTTSAAGAAPTVVTSDATSVTSSSTTLNGAGTPNGATTTGWFRYSATHPGSCNDTFGSRAPTSGGVSLGGGSTPVSFNQPLTGLTAGTTYYFCALASSTDGTGVGQVNSFVTSSSSSIIIGETNILSGTDSGLADLLVGNQVALTQTATLQTLRINVKALGTSAGNLTLAVYDSLAGGAPGSLKATTTSFVPVVGWNTVNVVTPVSLPAGTYWLVVGLNSGSTVLAYINGSGTERWVSRTYGAMPVTFPTTGVTQGAGHYSFNATLTP
ncbi:DUF4038 domain-containing protein [Myxococcus llanfairpwllgwyngyllgogerychwyrndrobwllllantysiliogogogochensis]|uniref:DUF4038 domain-containing protein n=1 Tax=Myxococcus llanfairpwllgwyngyllgogerychwyrndrobwllllantysiliogogogochensis TaxID=2590453 RepID=A0A540X763_9BACT|nr:DUF4038 domain-containing protein [Myxococcus llanfairpwllgwyngyllgogerychwyrndrobwllllantysiliogogogochensis]TQF17107.1 DUF4038 domain-containing protein [Myxococcus llanfairpwllgwyngyllgogerychwyrndrobwllllantysiliogogogochensis]